MPPGKSTAVGSISSSLVMSLCLPARSYTGSCSVVLIYINAFLLRIMSNFVRDRARGIYMAKHPDDPMPSVKLGKEQTDAMLGMQKGLFEAYEQASRAWLARVKS